MHIKQYIRSKGKLFLVVEPLTTTAHWWFYRRIEVNNRHAIPVRKPVLVAANHPTAFLEGVLISNFADAPMNHIVRGDMFKTPTIHAIMRSLNLIPIYRSKDGFNDRNRNDEVMDLCVETLGDKGALTVFVEGEHHLERRLRTVQRGIVKIAIASYLKNPDPELQIVPVGCTFQYGDRLWDTVYYNVGDPIYIKDHWDYLSSGNSMSEKRFSALVFEKLKEVVIHIEPEMDDELAEHILALTRNNTQYPILPQVVFTNRGFLAAKNAMAKLHLLSPEMQETLHVKTKTYFERLEKAGVQDEHLMTPLHGNNARLWFVLFGFFPFLLGVITSWPLSAYVLGFAKKKVKKREYYSPVVVAMGAILGAVYYLLILIACAFTGNANLIGLSLLLPILGWFANIYKENYRTWAGVRRAHAHEAKADWLSLRSEIWNSLGV